jgi:type IV secretion system protein VirB6
MGTLVLYVLVYNYINNEITKFMAALTGGFVELAGGLALILVTIWIMIQGYRIATGQSRESMMGFVVSSMRVVFIVTTATTLGIFGSDLHTMFTGTLQTDLNQLFTGNNTTFAETVDQNLAYTAVAMAAIDTIQTAPGDTDNVAAKSRAADFAIFGTASPPMAAGAMMLMFNLAIALFVGLGPLFILCLLFEQTKPLFSKWLMYGIGTLFGMAMLSFISGVVLKVTINVAAGLWTASVINGLIGAQSEGITTQAMEQGGIGLLLTMLLISAPPMAAQFFNGTLGSFMAYSAFGGAAARPGPQGQPPGSGAYGGNSFSGGGSGPAQASTNQGSAGQRTTGGDAFGNNPNLGQPRQTAGAEPGIRMNPQLGNAPTNPPPNNQAP